MLCIALIAAKDKIPHSKIMTLIAYISYPLYLLHHNMIFKWGLMGIPVMIAAATMITVLIEQPLMKWSKRILQ
jgi:peptidoglycan/LPS O-acetylase OafA/YrhL